MQRYSQPQPQRTSGAKAVALDTRKIVARYRLYQLVALLSAAVLALGLHIIFGR